jgi:hypothetical protein
MRNFIKKYGLTILAILTGVFYQYFSTTEWVIVISLALVLILSGFE